MKRTRLRVFVGDRRIEANGALICALAEMVIEEMRRKDESESETE